VVQLVRVRLTTFFDSEEVITSTPTLEGSSRIVTEFEAGTQEKYWTPCPLCNRHQILSFWRLTDEPIPQHTCEHCHRPSRQNEWLAQSQFGEWRAERSVGADGLPLTVRSFWLDCMVSPWLSWRDIREYRVAKELNDVHRDSEKLVTFYNTRLCKPWKDMSGQRADADVLYDRLETYVPEGTEYFDLPDPVRVVTCGVDRQDDRLEYTIYGFGLETEMWGIEHGVIWRDTTEPNVWQELTAKVYNRELVYADGVRKKIDRIFIDRGGHRAEQVDRWVKGKQPRVFPTKGNAGWGEPFVMSFTPTYVGDLRVPMLNIGTDGSEGAFTDLPEDRRTGTGFHSLRA
jgi:phage terminase large subunit GpA-like protein